MSTDAPPLMLNPAARLLWRSNRSVQLVLGGRAVTVDGLDEATLRALTARPGTPAARTAKDTGPAAPARRALRTLVDAGYLWERGNAECGDAECGDAEDTRLAPPRPRLASELRALAARRGESAAELLNARRHYAVAVHGTGRVGPHVGAVLAAAGVGRVHAPDHSRVKLSQATPGGLAPCDEGTRFTTATANTVSRAAPDADTALPPLGERPDLVILAADEPVERERRNALHDRGSAHLVVRLGADHGVVGPLVIPGLSSCMRCADLHRLDRDPAWTALAVQLSVPGPHAPASDVALATLVAGIAAVQALEFLDGGQPATIDGTLEVHLPDWRIRRRSWPAHPDCDCSQR